MLLSDLKNPLIEICELLKFLHFSLIHFRSEEKCFVDTMSAYLHMDKRVVVKVIR